ncbi:hypothetical protein [Devosia sp. 1635]|uniref:hypothetical protein n=1 Tax=Devosia sp. 1635 TaxID=2726066 RepID=UPI0015642989|nr:hypothetical protein [Devosia sp. 1635]
MYFFTSQFIEIPKWQQKHSINLEMQEVIMRRRCLWLAAAALLLAQPALPQEAIATAVPEIDAFLTFCWRTDADPSAVAAIAQHRRLKPQTGAFAALVEDEDTEEATAWLLNETIAITASTFTIAEARLRINKCAVSGGNYLYADVEKMLAELKSKAPPDKNLDTGTMDLCSAVNSCVWKGNDLFDVIFVGESQEFYPSHLFLVDLPEHIPGVEKP